MRILIIRLSSLGDVVLSTPIARLLRKRFPTATIDVAVAQEFAEVWQANPHVDRVITVDRSVEWKEMMRRIRSMLADEYDLVVDLQRNVRSAAIRWGRGQQVLFYKKHRCEKLWLVWTKRQFHQLPHIVERYIATLTPLGICDDGEGLEVWLPEDRESSVYPPTQRSVPAIPLLGIAPGARHATKQWLAERFTEVIHFFHKRGWHSVLFGSQQERILIERIAADLDTSKVINASGLTLYESLRLLDQCWVVLSNDSAMVHLAAARRVPVVVIYGSTVPALGFTPWRVPFRIVEADVSCRPCTHIGRSECPRGHFACMQQVAVSSVVRAIETLVPTVASGECPSH